VKPDSVDNNGVTSLPGAASKGDREAVRLLLTIILDYNILGQNLTGGIGQTPFLPVCPSGQDVILEVRLDQADVDPNLAHGWARTPYSVIVSLHRGGAVRTLLD
ncbi:hypothetical protein C7212DRAFT_49748, partial [Tuber magnatum]